jgi:hypothetical protein
VQICNVLCARSARGHLLLWAGLNLTYYALLCIAALAKSKTTVGIALYCAILFVVGATAILVRIPSHQVFCQLFIRVASNFSWVSGFAV